MRRLLDFIREHKTQIMTTGAEAIGYLCFLLAVYYLVVLGKELGWI